MTRVDLEDRRSPLCGEFALALADEALREALEPDAYIECHCWVFSPITFLALIEGASLLGLFPFVISQFAATEPKSFEFFVCPRRDRQSDASKLLRLQLGASDHVRSIHYRRQRITAAALRE